LTEIKFGGIGGLRWRSSPNKNIFNRQIKFPPNVIVVVLFWQFFGFFKTYDKERVNSLILRVSFYFILRLFIHKLALNLKFQW